MGIQESQAPLFAELAWGFGFSPPRTNSWLPELPLSWEGVCFGQATPVAARLPVPSPSATAAPARAAGKRDILKGRLAGSALLGKKQLGGMSKFPGKSTFMAPQGVGRGWPHSSARHRGGSVALPPPHSAVFWGAEASLGFPQSLVTSATSAWCVGKSGVTRPAACGCGMSARNAGRSSPWVSRDGTGTVNGAGGGQEGCT